ncbi:MAG: aldo/keto reductase [Cyanobacteriota bacterium]|nr:aldo/keto reductase [Cyanobacteriota bacterium]
METNTIAHQQDSVPIGVGTWAWGNQFLWGYRSDQDAVLQATFERAVQLGLRFFDTADSYGTGRLQGRSEALLGRFRSALPLGLSDRLVVATKLAPFPWRLGRQGLRRAFEASRQRLGGRLERVQLHWSTARYAPWQEGPLLEGLADLVAEGAVGSLGLSNVGPGRLRQVHQQLSRRGVQLASLQVQLSLLAPEAIAPGGVAEVCRELGITLIAYSPLALGLLARAPAEPMPAVSGARRLLFARLQPRIGPLQERLAAIARSRGVPPAAVALNWCRSHGAMPIVGLRRVEQAQAAAAAAQWSLEEAERQELDAAATALDVRMPANPFSSG